MSLPYGLPGRSTLVQPNWNASGDDQKEENMVIKNPLGKNLSGSNSKCVEDLSYNFIRCELAPTLDNPCPGNVLDLAKALHFKDDVVGDIEDCFYGDGKPASNFIETLVAEQPDLTISRLRFCLKQEGMPKNAVDTISSYNDADIIDNVLPMHLDELATKLTTRGRTNRDWEYAAQYFGMNKEIQFLKASARKSICSPTMELVNLIKAQRPSTKLTELICHLQLIKNDAAVKVLKTQLN